MTTHEYLLGYRDDYRSTLRMLELANNEIRNMRELRKKDINQMAKEKTQTNDPDMS